MKNAENDEIVNAICSKIMLDVLASDAAKTSEDLAKLKTEKNSEDITYLQGCLAEALTWIGKARDHADGMAARAAEVIRMGGDT